MRFILNIISFIVLILVVIWATTGWIFLRNLDFSMFHVWLDTLRTETQNVIYSCWKTLWRQISGSLHSFSSSILTVKKLKSRVWYPPGERHLWPLCLGGLLCSGCACVAKAAGCRRGSRASPLWHEGLARAALQGLTCRAQLKTWQSVKTVRAVRLTQG